MGREIGKVVPSYFDTVTCALVATCIPHLSHNHSSFKSPSLSAFNSTYHVLHVQRRYNIVRALSGKIH